MINKLAPGEQKLEKDRLAALHNLATVDAGAESRYDKITQLVARTLTPLANA
jgi:hypothetical protein